MTRKKQILGVLLVLLSVQVSEAQTIEFKGRTQQDLRPMPPTNLSANGGSIPILSYQSILDRLESNDSNDRERAAEQLYDDRLKHDYDVQLLVKYLNDQSDSVNQYTSAALVDAVEARPYKQPGLTVNQDVFRRLYNNSENSFTRANCIALLVRASTSFDDIQDIVVQSLTNAGGFEFNYAARAIQLYSPESIELFRILNTRVASSRNYRVEDAANAMVSIAEALSRSSEVYYADRLEEGAEALRDRGNLDAHANYISRAAQMIQTNFARLANDGDRIRTKDHSEYFLSDSLDPAIFTAPGVLINGKSIDSIDTNKAAGTITFLGTNNPLKEGLNFIERLNVRYKVWFESGILRRFENPYKNSYAIVAAIGDFKEINERNGTNYDQLDMMVPNAREFSELLIRKGFSREKIMFLPNSQASSDRINELLEEFWAGGRYKDADRLVFYFGGHGNHITAAGSRDGEATGYLVTSDFESNRPTRTGLLMKDLTQRHFENIVTKHVIMLIDSCSSGLALPMFQNSELEESDLNDFKALVTIESETNRPARNILVAGTGDERALYANGGVFTDALIRAFRGSDADFNSDNIVSFDELALFIKNVVRARAAASGHAQEPAGFKATRWGGGSVIFLDQ